MKRESNIELLRLVLMFFIVIHHGIVHGLGVDGLSDWGGLLLVNQQDMFYVSLLNACLIFSVNTFVLITGYFSLSLKLDKIVKLLVPVLLYTLLFATTPYLIKGDFFQAVKSLFFLSQGPYWFILDYLFLMVLTPLINEGYLKLDKRRSFILIGLLLVINCYFGFFWGDKVNNNGYTLMQFVLMYVIGRHIRVHGFELKQQWATVLFLGTSLINGALFYAAFYLDHGSIAWRLTYYNNPLVILSAIAFFLIFLKIRIQSRAINYLSASALAIYLIQNTPLVSSYYYQAVSNFHIEHCNIWLSLAMITVMSVVICLASIGIDKLCAPLTNRISSCIVNKINFVTN